MASRPVYAGRSRGSRHYYSQSRHERVHHAAAPKHEVKPRYAKAAGKKPVTHATYAKKGKAPEIREAAVQASMFGGLGASKHTASKTKERTAASKTNARKPANTHLAKKSAVHAGTSHKTRLAKKKGMPARKAREKYSKGKSAKSAALFAKR